MSFCNPDSLEWIFNGMLKDEKMSKTQEVFKKKYLISTFTATGHRVAFGYFKDGYEAKMAETCEWKHVKDFLHNFYITGCCRTKEFQNGIVDNTYTYCPFCGGKIVEKETEG